MRRLGKTVQIPTNGQNYSHPNLEGKSGDLRAVFSRRPTANLLATILLACLIIGINLGVILLVKDPQTRTIFSDVLSPLLDFTACIILFFAAKYSAMRSKRLAFAWGTIALATLFYFLGGVSWLILEVGLREPPFPSIADGLYLAYYPLFLLGAFLLVEKPATIGELATRTLDIGIILGSAIIGFWTLLIGPTINSSISQPLLQQAILVAYPVGDLVLIGALLLIIYNPSKRQGNTPVYFLAASLGAVVITDFLYSYQSLLGTYVSGRLLDLGWIVGSCLSILAGISQWLDVQSTKSPEITPRRNKFRDHLTALKLYLPYFWLTAVCLLFISGEMGFTPLPMGIIPFSLEVGGIIGLVVVRRNRQTTRLRFNGRTR